MKTNHRILLTLTIMIGIGMVACKKVDLSKISSEAWNPSLAVPLAIGEFGVYDILAKTDTSDLIVIDGQGALALVYHSEKVLLNASDVATIPDQNANFNQSAASYGIPPFPSYNGTQTFNYSDVLSVNSSGGGELYDVDFKSGVMTINTSTTMLHSVKYVLTFPDLTENGTVVTRTIDLVYSGTVPQTGSATINLNNGFADLTNGPNGYNELNVNVSLQVTGSGAPISGIESVDFNVNLQNLDFDLVHGYFGGGSLFNVLDTVDIKLFNNFTSGTVQFTNPSIEFKFVNSFGLPAQLGINSIKTKETNSGTEYPLTGYPSTLPINAPTTPGQSANSTLTLNTSNTSNLNTVLTPTPKKLIYNVSGAANPAGPAINFVKDDSELRLEGTLNLPLEGFGSGFMFSDTVDATVDFDPEFVESVLLRLNTVNGFPVEANVKVLLVDQNYVLLKDLTGSNQQIIAAAPVNSAGKATTTVQKINDYQLTGADILALKDMKYIIFEVTSQTFEGNLSTIVKMYDDYKFKVRVGMQVKATVNFN